MSWKQYGGINNLSKPSNVTVGTVVADHFTVRNSFLNVLFNVRDLQVTGNAHLLNNLAVSNNIQTLSLDVSQNMNVLGNIYLQNALFLDEYQDVFLYGNNNSVGINTQTPVSTLDICGSNFSTLNVYTSDTTNKNILARNVDNQGLVLATDTSGSYILFYNETPIPQNTMTETMDEEDFIVNNYSIDADATIEYLKGGILRFVVNKDTFINSSAIVSNRDASSHVFDETVVIYDMSSGVYLQNQYNNPNEYTGNALSLISNDNSSNTFLNISNPNQQGVRVGGGPFPLDNTRSMGVIDISCCLTPSMMIVSGNNYLRNNSTIGINKYSPQVDKYVLDINGKTYINNSEIAFVSQPQFQVFSMRNSKKYP